MGVPQHVFNTKLNNFTNMNNSRFAVMTGMVLRDQPVSKPLFRFS